MNRLLRFLKSSTVIVASCAAIAACGGDSETDAAISEEAFAAIEVSEKAASEACPCTIWPTTSMPRLAADSDTKSVNLGVRFTTDVSGYVTGIRFYKGPSNTGTHVGSLWSSSGQLLARASFTDETTSGWQTVSFSSPVPVNAGATYTASYLAPRGRYSIDQNYFNQAFVSPPLRATAGVYKYGNASSFPSSQWNGSNYWVDVMFSTAATPTPAPTPALDTTAALSWVASSSASVVGYRIYYGTSSGKYLQSRGAGMSAGTGNSFTVSELSPGNRYYFSVTSVNASGDESTHSNEVSKLIQ